MGDRQRSKMMILEYVRNNPGLTCAELAALANRSPVNVAGILGELDGDGKVCFDTTTKGKARRYYPRIDMDELPF